MKEMEEKIEKGKEDGKIVIPLSTIEQTVIVRLPNPAQQGDLADELQSRGYNIWVRTSKRTFSLIYFNQKSQMRNLEEVKTETIQILEDGLF